MTDFLDINIVPATIEIGGKKVPVPGISMEGFGHLIPRFPNILSELETKIKEQGAISLPLIIEVAGSAMGPILAAGLGYPGNEIAESKASQLDASTQMELLDKILERTMPRGIGPFVEQWAKLMERFSTPEQKIEKAIRSRIGPRPSKPSLDGVTQMPMSGA